MNSIVIISLICVAILAAMLTVSEFKKAFSKAKAGKLSVDEVIHAELLKDMPGICEGQYSISNRDFSEPVTAVNIIGKFNGNKFSARITSSDAMGENRVISIEKRDDEDMSLLLQENFKERYILKEHNGNGFIKRLLIWFGGLLDRDNNRRKAG